MEYLQLALFAVVLIAAYYCGRHDERHTARNEMADLIRAVKPAIRHNRSFPAIEHAAQAIRVYEEANQ